MTTFESAHVAITSAERNYRTLASAIAVFLGGYLVILALSGELGLSVSGVAGNAPEVLALQLAQTIFAVAVVVAGLLLAPARVESRLMASAVVIVLAVVTIASQAARFSSGFGGIPGSMTLANGFFMGVLACGAAWLVVRSARAGWLVLLLVAVLIPMPYLFQVANVPAAFYQLAAFAMSGLIGAGIIIAGRPLRD